MFGSVGSNSNSNSTGSNKRSRSPSDVGNNPKAGKMHTSHDLNKSVVVPLDHGSQKAMSLDEADNLVKMLKSDQYALRELYNALRDCLNAAARGEPADRALGELRKRIAPFSSSLSKSAHFFAGAAAASEVAGVVGSLAQWQQSPKTVENDKVAIHNLKVGMKRLEGLLNEFAPSATENTTIRSNAASVFGTNSIAPSLPLSQTFRPVAQLGQTSVPPDLSMSRQPKGQYDLPFSTASVTASLAASRRVGNPALPFGVPSAATTQAPSPHNPNAGQFLPLVSLGQEALPPVASPNTRLPIGNPSQTRAVTTPTGHRAGPPPQVTQKTGHSAFPLGISTIRPGMTVSPPKPTDLPPPPRNPNQAPFYTFQSQSTRGNPHMGRPTLSPPAVAQGLPLTKSILRSQPPTEAAPPPPLGNRTQASVNPYGTQIPLGYTQTGYFAGPSSDCYAKPADGDEHHLSAAAATGNASGPAFGQPSASDPAFGLGRRPRKAQFLLG